MNEPTRRPVDDLVASLVGENNTGYTAKKEERCITPPFGCGKPLDETSKMSTIEEKEYNLSGMCADCQREFFGTEPQEPNDEEESTNE